MTDTAKSPEEQAIVATRRRRIDGPWSPWHWRSHPAGADSARGFETSAEAFAAALSPKRKLPEPANPALGIKRRADGSIDTEYRLSAGRLSPERSPLADEEAAQSLTQ